MTTTFDADSIFNVDSNVVFILRSPLINTVSFLFLEIFFAISIFFYIPSMHMFFHFYLNSSGPVFCALGSGFLFL